MSTKVEVFAAIDSVIDPWMGVNYVTTRMAKFDEATQTLTIELGYPAKNMIDVVKANLEAALSSAGLSVAVEVVQKIVAHTVQRTLKVLPRVKNIIAVSSGKGGVGKSTVAANIALALSLEGAKVGMLDADIYGPSQPLMLGAMGRPVSSDGQMMTPVISHDLDINSVGFLVDAEEPTIWRGPLVAQVLQQLLNQTAWNDLDYLVIDMPPGTGDIQLTLSQSVPVTGAIVVTTPQDIALLDAKKGLKMFQKVNVPILGIVENMALFKCPQCGHLEHIFGEGGARRMSEQYGVEVLGQLPLDAKIREMADGGAPTVVADPDGEVARIYRDIALKAAAAVAKSARDMSLKMPSIRVETN